MGAPSIPGYEELTQIGKGGFSRVFNAEQVKFSRQVAIKVLNFGLADDDERKSFERETQLMGRVSAHPHIVTVHDTAFTAEGQPCIVMELYSGGTLADQINAEGGLAPQSVIDIGIAIASALEASHGGGVLHCDLKPQNILISEFGQPALGDFGISTFDEERTRSGRISAFTLHYAAPEIIEGDPPSVASDIYSLAATLYTALAGQRPFASTSGKQSAGQLARRVLLENPARLTEFGAPTPLDVVIRHAMEKDPNDRPVTAADFAQDLFDVGRQLGFSPVAPSTAIALADGPPEPVVVDRGLFAKPATPPDSGRSRRRRQPTPADDDATRGHTFPTDTESFYQLPAPEARPGEGAEIESMSESARRRIASMLLGVGGVLAVAVVLWQFAFRSDADPSPVPATLTTSATSIATGTPAVVQVVVAPAMPRDVTVTDAEGAGIRISWTSPDSDVIFEVRQVGVTGSLNRTDETEIVLTDLEGASPCVTVMAVRSSRVSALTEAACLLQPAS